MDVSQSNHSVLIEQECRRQREVMTVSSISLGERNTEILVERSHACRDPIRNPESARDLASEVGQKTEAEIMQSRRFRGSLRGLRRDRDNTTSYVSQGKPLALPGHECCAAVRAPGPSEKHQRKRSLSQQLIEPHGSSMLIEKRKIRGGVACPHCLSHGPPDSQPLRG